jgi:hypothetical protein
MIFVAFQLQASLRFASRRVASLRVTSLRFAALRVASRRIASLRFASPRHPVWQGLSSTMLKDTDKQPPHHPTPFLFILLKLQTGCGFQRPIFIEHYGSSAKRVDSSTPFLSSITVPAPHWWVPAPNACAALRFQRHTGGFQRPIFIEHYGSSATLVDSSAPCLCSITVPAPHWWIPAPHVYRALRFQRHRGGFQRPMLVQHYGSSATPVDSSAPCLCSITVPACACAYTSERVHLCVRSAPNNYYLNT